MTRFSTLALSTIPAVICFPIYLWVSFPCVGLRISWGLCCSYPWIEVFVLAATSFFLIRSYLPYPESHCNAVCPDVVSDLRVEACMYHPRILISHLNKAKPSSPNFQYSTVPSHFVGIRRLVGACLRPCIVQALGSTLLRLREHFQEGAPPEVAPIAFPFSVTRKSNLCRCMHRMLRGLCFLR